jgi:hypothetical protein
MQLCVRWNLLGLQKRHYTRVIIVTIFGAVALLCWYKVMQKHGFTYASYIADLMMHTQNRTYVTIKFYLQNHN